MAKFCSKCNAKIGFLAISGLCDNCYAEKKKEDERIAQETKAREEEEKKEKRQEAFDSLKHKISSRLERNESVFLYRTVYTEVDSMLLKKEIGKKFHVQDLMKLGVDGWHVVQCVPKTFGIGLENMHSSMSTQSEWGGGVGGNVGGVYLVLEKELKAMDDISDSELFDIVDASAINLNLS